MNDLSFAKINQQVVSSEKNEGVSFATPECNIDSNESVSFATPECNIDAYAHLYEIVTPVKVERLAYWLEGYNEDEAQLLKNGFSKGFSIECSKKPPLVKSVKNQKPALDNPEVLEKL